MTDLAGRYGAPSALRRRALVGLVIVVAGLGLAWLTWAAVYQSNPEVRSDLGGFEVADEHAVTAVLTVVRADGDVPASCSLRAIADDHAVVGVAAVTVDSGPREQRIEVSIRTERRATTVESLGCTAPGQPQRK